MAITITQRRRQIHSTEIQADKQFHKQTNTKAGRQAGRHARRQASFYTDTDTQADRPISILLKGNKKIEKDKLFDNCVTAT